MMKQDVDVLLKAVKDVRQRLADWRAGDRSLNRIPADIWAEAVGLARKYGVGPVCQTLSLGYNDLRARMPGNLQATGSTTPAPAFLEWIAPTSTTIEQCSLELQATSGIKLRLEMKGVPASGLALIIREFQATQ
jgi:hypothetical protein